MNGSIPAFLLSPHDEPTRSVGRRRLSCSIADKSLRKIATLMRTTFVQWDLSSRNGLLQRTDGRVKLLGLLFLLVVVSLKKEILPELCLAGSLWVLVLLSRLDVAGFYRRICLLAFLFGFVVVAPASLNIFTPGTIVLPIITFKNTFTVWIYTVPRTVGITREGLGLVCLMTLRIFNSLSICFLLLYTTPLSELMRALKVLRVPDTVLFVFVLTYKYLMIFTRTLEEIYLARKSRVTCRAEMERTGDWAAGRMAFFFRKTQLKCEEVYSAMMARGVRKEIKMQGGSPVTLHDLSVGICLTAAAVVLWWI